MDVVDEVGEGAVNVGDRGKGGGRAVGDGGRGVGPVVSGEEDDVGCGTGLADRGDGGLDGGGPGGDVGDVVGLVHETEGDLWLGSVLGGQLRPERGELGVSDTSTALADNVSVPATVVVDVDDAEIGDSQARGHESIVSGKVGGVEGTTKAVVKEVLPSNGKTEGVEASVSDKVLHLACTSGTRVGDTGDGASSVGAAAEIKSGLMMLVSTIGNLNIDGSYRCWYQRT